MIEMCIFTIVVSHPHAPSVVVLAEKGTIPNPLVVASEIMDISPPPGAPASTDTEGASSADADSGQVKILEPQLLPIWIGHTEAEAIMSLLEGTRHSRPLTHDLLANVIASLGSSVEHVVIDKVLGPTFFASICLNREGRQIHIDARPSDSIALALHTGAPIFADEDVLNSSAHRFMVKVSDGGELLYGSDVEMERFRSFIESVSPEDFM